MAATLRTPWAPDRRWADPFIVLLAMLALLAAAFTLHARQTSAHRPAERVSLQGRLTEVALTGPRLLTGSARASLEREKAGRQLREPWDRALLAVLDAEGTGRSTPPAEWIDPSTPPGAGGDRFRRVCLAAYAGGPLPDRADRDEVHRRLGHGYGADLLEARLLDREAGGEALRAQAKRTLMTRLAWLGGLCLVGLGFAAAGFAVGLHLVASRRQPPTHPLPQWSLSGRAAAIVFLGWFLAFFVAGNVAGLLLSPFPGMRWAAIPLGYVLHAAFGLRLFCWAEGIHPGTLWRSVAPGRFGTDLAWGAAFLALAVFLVFAVTLASSLILKAGQSPQRDLQDLVSGLKGWGPNLALFLTVAGLAPLWEELLFRGILLPVLARRHRMFTALTLSALIFGGIHLQPMGLPVLSTLGFAMGLAMRHTGSLQTPVLVHACWNGSLFLLMRGFA